VDGADRQLGPFESIRQFQGGPLVVGEPGEQFTLPAAIVEQMDEPGGHRPGLARTGRSDDAGGAGGMEDRPELILGEAIGGIDAFGDVDDQTSGVEGLPVDHRAEPRNPGSSGAAIHPRRGAVGEHHVLVAAGADTEGFQLLAPPPDRVAVSCVVGVGPAEEEEALPIEEELASQLVGSV
jgi:hypothetical protein